MHKDYLEENIIRQSRRVLETFYPTIMDHSVYPTIIGHSILHGGQNKGFAFLPLFSMHNSLMSNQGRIFNHWKLQSILRLAY